MNTVKTKKQEVPKDFTYALSSTPKAKALWDDLTPLAQRDFISWIEGAKQEETRARRISVACDKLLKGDRRPCCYAVVPMKFYKALGDNPKAKAVWGTLSSHEKRDLTDWIEEAKDKEEHAERISEVCAKLTNGK